MLIDDNVIALNKIAAIARKQVELYSADHPRLDDAHQSRFKQFAADAERLAAAAENGVTALGDLPQDSDPEADALQRLGVDLKALFSLDADASVASSMDDAEAELDEAIGEALDAGDLPKQLAADLIAYRATLADHRAALQAMQ